MFGGYAMNTQSSSKSILIKKLELVREVENAVRPEVIVQYQTKALNDYVEEVLATEADTEATSSTINASPNLTTFSYRNFDLRLSKKRKGQLYVEVIASPEGMGNGTIALPPYGTLKIAPGGLARNLSAIGYPTTNTTPDLAITLRSLGEDIGKAMLPDNVRLCFERNLSTAIQAGEGLRIRLYIQDDDIAAIPWEVARIGEDFLSLRPRTPIVRFITLNEAPTPLHVNGPLRLLGIVSDPKDLPSLNVALEQAQIENALIPLIEKKCLCIKWLSNGNPDELQDRLRSYQPHILHYIGHGSYDHKSKSGTLWFKDRDGNKQPRTAEWLATLLRDSTVRFVFLNTCESGHAVGSLSEALVRRGVPAVLGMQTEVFDNVAISFASGFYRSLADRYPVDVSLVEGRKAVFNHLANDLGRPDWAEPVLYMSVPDGELFD
jgi:hypothetical protein